MRERYMCYRIASFYVCIASFYMYYMCSAAPFHYELTYQVFYSHPTKDGDGHTT